MPASRIPHPASRVFLELPLRLLSLGLLAWMLWASLETHGVAGVRAADERTLDAALRAWTLSGVAESLHVTLDTAPDAVQREWLVALRRSGAHVSWASPGIPATALEVEAVNDPAGGARLLVAAPAKARVELSDAVSVLDTVRPVGAAATMSTPVFDGIARAAVGAQQTRAVLRDSLERRAAYLVGRAGWEAKFVIAALEERGWTVYARLHVAPGVDVTQGGTIALDTARVGAAVALDSSAAREAERLVTFVRSGGGLVLAGDAARGVAFASVAAGAVGQRVPAAAVSFSADAPRRALGLFPIVPVRRDAVPLEVRGAKLIAAARRVGAGRVVQVGYDDTWRWRMTGGDEAPEAHRLWWTAIVGSVAYRPAHPLRAATPAPDAAPLAHLVDALGPASQPRRSYNTPIQAPAPHGWMLALLVTSLLAEWTSRRLRGAP
jgi:hypothetical protein